MHPFIEAVKADVRRRMGSPHRQNVGEISQQLRNHEITLYKWRNTWRQKGVVVQASQNEP